MVHGQGFGAFFSWLPLQLLLWNHQKMKPWHKDWDKDESPLNYSNKFKLASNRDGTTSPDSMVYEDQQLQDLTGQLLHGWTILRHYIHQWRQYRCDMVWNRTIYDETSQEYGQIHKMDIGLPRKCMIPSTTAVSTAWTTPTTYSQRMQRGTHIQGVCQLLWRSHGLWTTIYTVASRGYVSQRQHRWSISWIAYICFKDATWLIDVTSITMKAGFWQHECISQRVITLTWGQHCNLHLMTQKVKRHHLCRYHILQEVSPHHQQAVHLQHLHRVNTLRKQPSRTYGSSTGHRWYSIALYRWSHQCRPKTEQAWLESHNTGRTCAMSLGNSSLCTRLMNRTSHQVISRMPLSWWRWEIFQAHYIRWYYLWSIHRWTCSSRRKSQCRTLKGRSSWCLHDWSIFAKDNKQCVEYTTTDNYLMTADSSVWEMVTMCDLCWMLHQDHVQQHWWHKNSKLSQTSQVLNTAKKVCLLSCRDRMLTRYPWRHFEMNTIKRRTRTMHAIMTGIGSFWASTSQWRSFGRSDTLTHRRDRLHARPQHEAEEL